MEEKVKIFQVKKEFDVKKGIELPKKIVHHPN